MHTSEREIVTTRTFKAPCEVLFAAWSNPEQLKRWWGPKGFTNAFHEFDFRPDGMWKCTMRSPDGVEYPNESKFIEIIPQERIVFDHLSGHQYRATAAFSESEGKTLLVWSMVFEDETEYNNIKAFITKANEENLDRLEALLA